MRWQLGALRFVPHRPGEQGHRGTGVPPPQSLTANSVGQAPDTATGDPSGSRTATGALVLPVDSPTGPPCTPHAGVPRGPHPRPHCSPSSHRLAPGPSASSAAGRVREEGRQALISHSPSVLSVSYFFFFFFFSPFLPPSSQKGWFSSESLKHICIPKTSLGINSSQCRGLFFLLLLYIFFPPYAPDFHPFSFSLQTRNEFSQNPCNPGAVALRSAGLQGIRGLSFSLASLHAVLLMLLSVTMRGDQALSPISCTNLPPQPAPAGRNHP